MLFDRTSLRALVGQANTALSMSPKLRKFVHFTLACGHKIQIYLLVRRNCGEFTFLWVLNHASSVFW